MATKKKTETAPVPKFTKEQIVSSNKYRSRKDFLNGNLKEGQAYTLAEVDGLLGKHYKKGKGE